MKTKFIHSKALYAYLVAALLASAHPAVATKTCAQTHNTTIVKVDSKSPLQLIANREIQDLDSQFFMNSHDSLDILLTSSVHETLIYKKSTLEKIFKLPEAMDGVHFKFLPAIGEKGSLTTVTALGELVILDIKTQSYTKKAFLDLLFKKFTQFDISADGQTLAINVGSEYYVFDVATGRTLLKGRARVAGHPKLSKDGKELALIQSDALVVLNVNTGTVLRKGQDEIFGNWPTVYSQDGHVLAGPQFNPNFSILVNVRTGLKIGLIQGHATSVSADGRYVAAALGKKTRIYDVQTQTQIAEIEHSEMHWSSHFSEDGKKFYVSLQNGKLLSFDLATRESSSRQ